VAGPQQPKVAVIESGKLGLVEPLDDREDSGIDESHVAVTVSITEIADAAVILRLKILDPVSAEGDVVEQGHVDSGMEPLVNPVVHLHQHRSWNHQAL